VLSGLQREPRKEVSLCPGGGRGVREAPAKEIYVGLLMWGRLPRVAGRARKKRTPPEKKNYYATTILIRGNKGVGEGRRGGRGMSYRSI